MTRLQELQQRLADKQNALELLHDLVTAMDNSFISSWQTTAGWQKQLDAAREFLNRG